MLGGFRFSVFGCRFSDLPHLTAPADEVRPDAGTGPQAGAATSALRPFGVPWGFLAPLLAATVMLPAMGWVSRTTVCSGTDHEIARYELSRIEGFIHIFMARNGRPPTAREGLSAAIGPTVPPMDPWGHEYVYVAPSRTSIDFDIVSYGSDGAPGGVGMAADLRVSDL